MLASFVQNSEWKLLINKRSTTFRNLTDTVKENLSDNIDNDIAFETIFEQPTLLKRPVLIHNHQLHLGFKEQQYQDIFIDERASTSP